ncbi:MAG: hypothetical protein KF819_37980 [Labilithrix sp.]|nr:hypothetical protein [Labilithrix sp.]
MTLRGQTKSALLKETHLGAVKLARADAPAHVIADTFLRFEGLARPYVIVTELGAGQRYDVGMHVALTRATLQTVVAATRAEIAADSRHERPTQAAHQPRFRLRGIPGLNPRSIG